MGSVGRVLALVCFVTATAPFALGAPPERVASFEGQLLFTDHRFELTVFADGTAEADWWLDDPDAALDDVAPLQYTGKWRAEPFACRLTSADSRAVHPNLRLRGPTRERRLAAELRLGHGPWIPTRGLRQSGDGETFESPTGDAGPSAAEADEEAKLAGLPLRFAIEVDEVYVWSNHEGRRLASFRVMNFGDVTVGDLVVKVVGESGGKRPGYRVDLAVPGTLEPTESKRYVDLDLGAASKPGERLGLATATPVAAHIVSGEGATARLRSADQSVLLTPIEILFAWTGPDDRHEVLVRNNGGQPLSGVELEVVYLASGDAVIERLPLAVGPLAAGEVRLLHEQRPAPRGGKDQRYFLYRLDKTRVRVARAYPANSVDAKRLAGDAREEYERVGIRHLKVQGDRHRPVFTFEVVNKGSTVVDGIVFAVVGTDFHNKVMALVRHPLTGGSLAAGGSRPVRVPGDPIYGLADAVLTWTVIVVEIK